MGGDSSSFYDQPIADGSVGIVVVVEGDDGVGYFLVGFPVSRVFDPFDAVDGFTSYVGVLFYLSKG